MPGLPLEQSNEMLRWLAFLWLSGFLARPLAVKLLPGQSDQGYLTGKLLGWLIMMFVPWTAAALGLASFSEIGPVLGLLALGAIYVTFRGETEPLAVRPALWMEALFVLLFVLGLIQRLTDADLVGLEKFTDFGLMNAAMRAEAMPPEDAWFAGAGVNYYYFGHAGAALWALLVRVPADHGYQLHMASLFALTGIAVFHLLKELLSAKGARLATVIGGAGTVMVLYAGNGHSFLYNVFRGLIPTPKPEYWYPDSTRFIGFEPQTLDKAFTEFPAYGFRVGDLHAHLLATPQSFFALIVLAALLRSGWGGTRIAFATALLLGWLLGLSYMTNAWDVAVLGLVALFVWCLLLVRQKGGWAASLDRMVAPGIAALALAALTAAPFAAEFVPFASAILPVEHRTPLWQLAVIYGHGVPAFLCLAVLVSRRRLDLAPEVAFIALLALVTIVLIIIPELVFVKDIYGADFARANTMFKLSFRSQPFLQIVALATIGLMVSGRRWQGAVALGLAAPLVATLAYAEYSFHGSPFGKRLDGLNFLREQKEMVLAARTLPIKPGQSIIEAGSDSFTQGARVASMTGLPSVIGWAGHEWLWRDDADAAFGRRGLVDAFYATDELAQRCAKIARFGIRYIVLGKDEAARYPDLDRDALLALGLPIIDTSGGLIIEVSPARCAL
jgi:uncharacterized membrane protein